MRLDSEGKDAQVRKYNELIEQSEGALHKMLMNTQKLNDALGRALEDQFNWNPKFLWDKRLYASSTYKKRNLTVNSVSKTFKFFIGVIIYIFNLIWNYVW